MPATPAPGVMDNPYYDWSPIGERPVLRWPGDARVAVAVVLSLEHADWYPPEGTLVPPSLRSGPYPRVLDLHTVSQYEYGNRVGVFRITDVLDRHGIRPTVAMDAAVMRRSPFLVDHLLSLRAEFVGHGVSSDQLISQAMTQEEELRQIATAAEQVTAATGRPPRGWLGAEYGESSRTVALLAAQGFDYVLDWPTDEQPHPMKVPTGVMTNLPVMIELDDVVTHIGRFIPVQRFARMITEQFDRLYEDGSMTGRVFVLNVHPWVMGQPFRIRYFAEAMRHLASHERVWFATGAEIVDAYCAQVA